ncbi:M24 family metallopeptidase [Nocardioides sp. B-3]|uniref:M24 family metallopeptidase n=1 Tax=Nocardioides sp. B-3 TaxID=2895565 RepID=UPI0021538998|nr:M24 family metallopeptidase [Nocardioides sp. B-3]
MEILAHGLSDLGLLPVSAEESLDPESKLYARWTLHGTSHMLGMDVHDCGRTSKDIYPNGDLAEGMVLTVEPGLYFREDDLLVPEELRGIGIRIEDDILGHRRRLAEPVRRPSPHLLGGRGVDGCTPLVECHHYDAYRCRSCSLPEVPRAQQLSDKEAHARSLVPAVTRVADDRRA